MQTTITIILVLIVIILRNKNISKAIPGSRTRHVSIPFSKTSKMLDEDAFWKIVDVLRKRNVDQAHQEHYLIKEIEKLTPEEMVGFRLRTDRLLYETYTSPLWCAAYIMNGGCSDDGFEYFRCWLISRGRDAFDKAKADPDTLISEVTNAGGPYEFEDFWYVALKAFNNRTGKNLYDYIDYDNFKTREGNYPAFELTWNESDPNSMKSICPMLYAHFNPERSS